MRVLLCLMCFLVFSAVANARGLGEFRTFCGIQKTNITFKEIEDQLGIPGEWHPSPIASGRSSLFFAEGEVTIEFSGKGTKSSKIGQVTISMADKESGKHSSKRNLPKIRILPMPGGIQLGMKRSEFEECINKLYKDSPGYSFDSHCNDGGTTDEDDFCFNSKTEKSSCNQYSVFAFFNARECLAMLHIFYNFGCRR